MNKRKGKTWIVGVIVLLIVGACVGSLGLTGRLPWQEGKAAITVPAGAQAGDLVDLKPCTYEAGGVKYAADCGTLVVPENRSNPESRLIALPVIRVRALNGSQAEPILFFMGGPGVTNLHFKALDGLVDERDFVQVGYRGIDGSSVLDCPETVAALKSADDLLSQAALDSFGRTITRCAERLQGEGVDITGYTLLERVEDMEAARAALGYDKINLLSESVGTRTAIIYGETHPESIKRSVMIGVNPPGHFVWKAEIIDEQLKDYSRLCAQDPACSARTKDLAETMRQVVQNMPSHWLFVPIKPGVVKLSTFFALFHTSTNPLSAPWAFDAWLSAAEGDPSGLAMLSLMGEMIFPTSFVWGESSATGTSTDLPEALKYFGEAKLEDTILGTPGSTWMWGGMSSWPVNLLPEKFRRVQPSEVETLLVSGDVDMSTPPQFARDELLPYLSKGQQVILAGFGHSDDVWSIQPAASVRLINSFYDTGTADLSLFTAQPIPFDVGRVALPELMKIGLGILVAIPLGLAIAAWLVLRLVRGRKSKRQQASREAQVGEPGVESLGWRSEAS